MRNFYAMIFCALILAGCSAPRWQHQTACEKQSMEDIVAGIVALVTQEGMTVDLVNEKVGIVQASTPPDKSIWTGLTSTRHWSFTVSKGSIMAYASERAVGSNGFGATTSTNETFFGDKTRKDQAWYWNVRNGLETLCDNITIVVDVKKNRQ